VVPASSEELAAIRAGFALGGSLGGRDQRTKLDYSKFEALQAWRIQHTGLWGKYAMEHENIQRLQLPMLRDSGVQLPTASLREPFQRMAAELPASLDATVNEVYLTHGTKPESILAILSGGLNERFSGGLFGHGTYLAEDVAKNDQYCTYDDCHGCHPELHKMLFDDHDLVHPGRILYVFVCRVMLGHFVRTKDGQTDVDSAQKRSVWSSQGRELAVIPGSSPPILHHSLVVETGGKVARFREFISFHGDRLYPEYIVAYKRS
jgi:hypothetical protein